MKFIKQHLLLVICFFILLELIVAVLFTNRLITTMNTVEVKSATSTIPKENIVIPVSELQYYYDLKPDSVQTWSNSQLADITTHYSINHDGLNELRMYPASKPANTFRILTLGDSNAFGLYVPITNNFSEQLEKQFQVARSCRADQTFDVINLGVPGYDLRYTVERFKQKGLKYEPDLVIWEISSEDFNEILEYMRAIIIDLDKKGQSSTSRIKAQEQLKLKISETERLSYQKDVLNLFTKLYSGPLLILSWSHFSAKETDFLTEFIGQRPRTYFLSLEQNITDEVRIKHDSHLNTEGHSLVAKKLFSYLTDEPLTLCAPK